MTTWTAVPSSVADQGRRLAAATGPVCSSVTEKGRLVCTSAAEMGLQACSCAAEVGRQAGTMAWKLTRSTGKAAWILGTSFLVLAVPIILLDAREAQDQLYEQNQLELQRAAYLFGGGSV